MGRRARTGKPHERSFEKAPRVRAGESVGWTRADDDHPGWFFGTDPHGVEGFFPRSWFEIEERAATARALRDYDAAELTIAAGVGVEILETESGWLRVRSEGGQVGWIPASCVE